MSVIAVEGLNLQITLFQVGKMLAKTIQGQFEPLNFVTSECSPYKICYLRLSDKLDPLVVIERINNVVHGKKKSVLNAYIPDSVPNFSIPPTKIRKNKAILEDAASTQVLSAAHAEIMTELQHKYTGLYDLSSKGSHTLLEAMGMTIYERLRQLLTSQEDLTAGPFYLTSRYRKAHPHFGDFQLILGTLHRLEDSVGAPRTQLQEAALTVTPKDIHVVDNVPYTVAQKAISKYTERIAKKEHVGGYKLEPGEGEGEEGAARRKVQAELVKMMPYLPTIMKQVVTNHFAEDHKKSTYHKMRMYGEPFLPGKEYTLPVLARLRAQRITRWNAMYNLLVFDVPMDCYGAVMALDGTSLGGAKIIMRSSNSNVYRVKPLKKQAADVVALDDDEEGD